MNDAVADIVGGITAVREVVQANRYKRTIQHRDLDSLRGSLDRFNTARHPSRPGVLNQKDQRLR